MSKYVYVILVDDVSNYNKQLLESILPNTRIAIRNTRGDNIVYGFHGVPEDCLLDAEENFYNAIKKIKELKDVKIRVLNSVEYNVWIDVTDKVEEIKNEAYKLYRIRTKLKSWK